MFRKKIQTKFRVVVVHLNFFHEVLSENLGFLYAPVYRGGFRFKEVMT